MKTEQEIKELAEREYPDKNLIIDYPCSINMSIGKKAAYIKAYADCQEEMSKTHTEAAETTISRLYDESPANKAELVMLFNLGAEHGRESGVHIEAILRKYAHRMHESLFFDLINAFNPIK